METKLTPIKKTNSVSMSGNRDFVTLNIFGAHDKNDPQDWQSITIPMKIAYQVKRGLTSYTQRFYRKVKK